MIKGIHLPLRVTATEFIAFETLSRLRAAQPAVLEANVDPLVLFVDAAPYDLINYLADVYASDHRLMAPPSPFATHAVVSRALFDIQRRAWQEIVTALDAAGVESLVFKGIHHFGAVHAGLPRLLDDIDLLVRSEQAPRAQQVIRDLGYQQSGTGKTPRGYEYAPLWKYVLVPELDPFRDFIRQVCEEETFSEVDGRLHFGIHVDLHDNVVLPLIAPQDIWKKPDDIVIGGVPGRAPRRALLVWMLATRCYVESFAGDQRAARFLADIVVMERNGGIPYGEVFDLASRYDFSVSALFYVFRFLEEFGELDVPAGYVQRLGERRRGTLGQRGDFLPALFGRRWVKPRGHTVVYDLVRTELRAGSIKDVIDQVHPAGRR